MNVNGLSPDERRVLAKRSRKLRGILGEPLRESIVASALNISGKTVASSDELAQPAYQEVEGLRSAGETDDLGSAELEDETQNVPPDTAGVSPTRPQPTRSPSIATLDETLRMVRDSKEYRRRKLEKLVAFLGEQVPEASLLGWPVVGASYALPPQQLEGETNSPNQSRFKQPLTATAKKVIIKRSNKLEQMLGHRLPSELLAKTDTGQLARESIFSLKTIVQDPDILLDLMNCMTDFDAAVTEERPPPSQVNSSTGGPESNAAISDDEGESVDGTTARMARLRKLKKLQKFFGTNFDPIAHLEAVIIDDLEKSIDDEIQIGKNLQDLKDQVGELREALRKNGSFNDLVEDEDASIASTTARRPLLAVSTSLRSVGSDPCAGSPAGDGSSASRALLSMSPSDVYIASTPASSFYPLPPSSSNSANPTSTTPRVQRHRLSLAQPSNSPLRSSISHEPPTESIP